MALENIETLEKDIASEMKAKEATVRQVDTVATGVGTAVQTPVATKKVPVLMIVSVVLLLAAGGASFFGYQYYIEMTTPPVIVPITNATSSIKTPEMLLRDMSPEFPDAIGRYVAKVQKSNLGYTVYINSYSPVFAYMLRNEQSYAGTLAKALGVPQDSKNIYAVPIPDPIPVATTSTSTKKAPVQKVTQKTAATSTSTSTQATTTAQLGSVREEDDSDRQILSVEPVPFSFYDITVSNQNIRVGKSGDNAFYYSFIQEKAIVFSSSVEGILSLKNDILR